MELQCISDCHPRTAIFKSIRENFGSNLEPSREFVVLKPFYWVNQSTSLRRRERRRGRLRETQSMYKMRCRISSGGQSGPQSFQAIRNKVRHHLGQIKADNTVLYITIQGTVKTELWMEFCPGWHFVQLLLLQLNDSLSRWLWYLNQKVFPAGWFDVECWMQLN